MEECNGCEDGLIEETCGFCSGSGEGSYDGSTCSVCHGSGTTVVTCECLKGIERSGY